MLLGLFVVLIGLSLFLVGLSYYSKEALYSLVGFSSIFILSLWTLLPGNLQVASGDNISISYTYSNGSVVSTNVVNDYQYENFNDTSSRFFGFWLALLGASGFGLSLFEMKGAKKKPGDDDTDEE